MDKIFVLNLAPLKGCEQQWDKSQSTKGITWARLFKPSSAYGHHLNPECGCCLQILWSLWLLLYILSDISFPWSSWGFKEEELAFACMLAHAEDEVVTCSLLFTRLPLEAADAVTTTQPPCSSQVVLAPAITSVVLGSERCNDDAKKNFCFYHNWAYRDSCKQWQLLWAKIVVVDARGREEKQIKEPQWSHVERLPSDKPGCQLLHGITWIWINS